MKNHYTYMLRCIDNSIYTGYATDWQKRVLKHFSKEGAKYTRSHEPLIIEIVIQSDSKEASMKLEYRIKRLKKEQKEKLIGFESNEELVSFLEETMGDKISVDCYSLVLREEILTFNREITKK